MLLLIVLSFLFLFICWLFFTPITLNIDTEKDNYLLQIWGLGQAKLLFVEEEFLVCIKIGWWSKQFNISPFQKRKTKKEKPTKTKRKKARRKFSFAKAIRLIKSFKVKKFQLDLDTDNYITNAYLFPIFHFLRLPEKSVNINFMGRNECQLEISNRIASILLAFIK